MSCENTEYWRIISKYSTISGATPSIPPSQDHTDGTWSPTDLYVGEFFVNVADDKVWVRTINGILPISSTGGTGSYIGDYVSKSLGGTYSGKIYAPTMSSITFTGTNFYGDNFEGLTTEATFNGNFIGDGSALTGITAVWTGGTVSNPVYFTNTLDVTNDLTIDGSISTNNPYIDIQDELWVNGGVSASYFVGDGSLLTNLPTGATSNDYTIDAYLDGTTLKFDRTDLSDAYSVDLSPITSTNSITGVNFDGTLYTIYLEDGTEWSVDMTTFNSLSITGAITADEFNGGTFNGTFVGTYSNDIYTTGVELIGNEEIFTRTDGSTYSVNLSSLVVSGATPSLSDVLETSQLAGNHNIYFPNLKGIRNSSGVISSTGLTFDSDSVTLFAGTGSIDDYGSRSTVAAAKSGDVSIQVENNVEFNMNLNGLGAGYFTVYGYSGFKGIEYSSDYSANYTNRSLVDKEYVDNASGPTPSLSDVLLAGNNAGDTDIIIGAGHYINNHDSSATIRFTDDIRITNGDGFVNPRVHVDKTVVQVINDDGSNTSNISVYESNLNISSDNGSTDTSNIYMDPATMAISVGDESYSAMTYSRIDFTPQSIWVTNTSGQGIEYTADYSATFTNRSLVDKEYVDNLTPPTPTLYSVLSASNSVGSSGTIIENSGRSILSIANYGVSIQNTDPSQNDLLNAVYADENGSKLESYDTIGNYSLVKSQQSAIQMVATDGSAYNQFDMNGSLFQVNGASNINFYSSSSGVFRADAGSSLSELNLSGSVGYIINTAGEGRNTFIDAQYDYAELKQDEGSSVTRMQVSIDNGFYQSQMVSTGILKGVSKTNFRSLQTTDDTIISVVWPLSGLEAGTTTVGIKATVTGMKTDETTSYISELYAAVRMNGYAVTIFGGVDKLEKSEFTTATSTIEIESSTVAIRVTGEAATDINWSVKYELIYSV